MQHNKDYYDCYWANCGWWNDEYDGIVSHEERMLIELLVASGTNVLDYGCGNASRYPNFVVTIGGNYHGVDISQTAVEHVKTSGLEACLFNDDGALPWDDNTFDTVICFEVLEHLLEPDKALQEIHRVLKPSGALLASVPNFAFFTNRLEFLLTGFLCPGGSPITARNEPWRDPHIRFFNAKMLIRMLVTCGYSPESVLGSRWRITEMPVLYKLPLRTRRIVDFLFFPFTLILSMLAPSLFSPRLFVVVTKNQQGTKST